MFAVNTIRDTNHNANSTILNRNSEGNSNPAILEKWVP